jgi:hypothetical protein
MQTKISFRKRKKKAQQIRAAPEVKKGNETLKP